MFCGAKVISVASAWPHSASMHSRLGMTPSVAYAQAKLACAHRTPVVTACKDVAVHSIRPAGCMCHDSSECTRVPNISMRKGEHAHMVQVPAKACLHVCMHACGGETAAHACVCTCMMCQGGRKRQGQQHTTDCGWNLGTVRTACAAAASSSASLRCPSLAKLHSTAPGEQAYG